MRTAICALLVTFIFGAAPFFVSAATAQFIFTTDPQTLAQNELSQSISIQSQDAEGKATTTGETVDLGFSSTSSIGEFLNASGNPVSTVMNKGTTNRTFYYRDQSSGHYTLTVKATGRTSGQSWSITQGISVTGAVVSTTTSSASSPSSESASASGSATQTVSSAPPPAAPAAGGGGTSLPPPQITARAKVPSRAVAGADVSFETTAVGLKKEPLPNARFVWSFGDGATAEGKKVLHAYHLPASYVVLVEASSGEWSATDRADIIVVTPQILLSRIQAGTDGFIEVKNNGTDDLDLSRWFLRSGSAFFSFPNGTILKKGSAVPFVSVVTKLVVVSDDAALLYPNGTEAVHYIAVVTSAPEPIIPPVSLPKNIKVEPRGEIQSAPDTKPPALSEQTASTTELVASVGDAETSGSSFVWAGLALGVAVIGAGGYLSRTRQKSVLSQASQSDAYEIVE